MVSIFLWTYELCELGGMDKINRETLNYLTGLFIGFYGYVFDYKADLEESRKSGIKYWY